MNILIAPDSFKGSLSALEFCRISAEQIQLFDPTINLHLMPLSDGGEGMLEAILANVSGQLIPTCVQNPLGKHINAHYAILDNTHTAIIEMAQASGLPLLSANEANPMRTSSFGTGELIKHALDQQCQQLIIGLGGSATNDGGMGMLSALGVKFIDAQQQVLVPCGQALTQIKQIDYQD